MKIQINTDNHIVGREELILKFEDVIGNSLERFNDHVTRIEAHLGDVNSHKESVDDKRCMLEARVEGLRPVAVTHHGATMDIAVKGALNKLKKSLDSTLGRLEYR